MDTLRIPEDIPIENAMVSKSLEGAQTRVEGHNFDIRKRLVDYDDVLNKHREIIYGRRRQILDPAPTRDGNDKSRQEELRGLILEKINLELENIVNLAQTETKGVDHELISKEFFSIIPFDEASQQKVREEIEKLKEAEKIKEFLEKIATQIYEAREKQYGPEVSRQIEKLVLLNTIDSLWINHLEDIDYLREGVGLRGYAARDPLVEYKGEAFKLFEDLIRTVDYETVHRIFKIQIMPQQQQQTAEPISATAGSAQVATSSIGAAATEESPIPETKKKIGRNDPCPCGSGLKYKKCGLIDNPTHQENLANAKA